MTKEDILNEWEQNKVLGILLHDNIERYYNDLESKNLSLINKIFQVF